MIRSLVIVDDRGHPKTARTDHEVHRPHRAHAGVRARSIRRRTSSQAELLRLFEAARWAPSSGNEQPWRFVVGRSRHRSPEAFAALLSIADGEEPRVGGSRAGARARGRAHDARAQRDRRTRTRGTTPARPSALLTLQATRWGCRSGRWKASIATRAREACAVPAPFEPAVVMAIGYAGDPESLAHREAPRRRAPAAHAPADRRVRVRRTSGDETFS